jgi:DNA-binding GntR family transcriptional regulator
MTHAEHWQVPEAPGTPSRGRPESLVDYAVRAVRNELLTGLLRPGERLTEEATAQRLGISHIPVREAFRFLEAEGHVVRDARRGLRVAQLSAAEAQDIYRTRALLETEANRLGVPELTAEDDRRLEELAAEMEQAAARGDLGAYRRSNRAFHFVAFERSGRPWLVRFLTNLWDAAARYQTPLFAGGAWQAPHLAHHRDLLEALRGRDPERVNQLMHEHRKWLLSNVQSHTGLAGHAHAHAAPRPHGQGSARAVAGPGPAATDA